jgi:hypothetical protein
MKKIKGKNKGITLIALIVTIVVLLILAGVSIAMLTGENGIIAQANNAKESNRGGEVKETVDLAVTENEMANYTGETKKTRAEVIQELYDNGKLTDEEVEELESSNVIKIGNVTIDFSGLEDDTVINNGNSSNGVSKNDNINDGSESTDNNEGDSTSSSDSGSGAKTIISFKVDGSNYTCEERYNMVRVL